MIKEDFDKIGLELTKYINYNIITVRNWEKFLPLINLPADDSLIKFFKRWHTLATDYYEQHIFCITIHICGVSLFYRKDRYKSNVTIEKVECSLEAYCPYDIDDVRRYLWINRFSQLDYSKICDDILKTLINVVGVKNG